MATTDVNKDLSTMEEVLVTPAPPDPPEPPDPPDGRSLQLTLTTTGLAKDCSDKGPLLRDEKSVLIKNKQKGNSTSLGCLKTVHIINVPLKVNYEMLCESFEEYGRIQEVRMNLNDVSEKWEAWVSFLNHDEAFNASSNIENIVIFNGNASGALCERAPNNLDIYRPADWINRPNSTKEEASEKRKPKPPKWLIVTTKDEYGNYFKISRYVQKKVGAIKAGDISRFGKNSVLVHAKSSTQSHMLNNLNTSNDEMIKEVKPHLSFSYGRGVIFDRDLYEFPEEEILDMCPAGVWKVNKVPRTSMIILTFEDTEIPFNLVIENERFNVKPFKQKPLQCFKCFKFGHPSRVCKNEKLCNNCSQPEHKNCTDEAKCINCNQNHKPSDKQFKVYKLEEAAINKS